MGTSNGMVLSQENYPRLPGQAFAEVLDLSLEQCLELAVMTYEVEKEVMVNITKEKMFNYTITRECHPASQARRQMKTEMELEVVAMLSVSEDRCQQLGHAAGPQVPCPVPAAPGSR